MPRRKEPGTEGAEDTVADAVTMPPETAAPPETVAPPEPEPASVLPEPQPEPVATPTPAPPRRGGVVWPLIGGALAAVGGFAVAELDVLDLRPADPAAEIAALRTEMQALSARPAPDASGLEQGIADLQARLDALETAPAPDPSRLDELAARLEAIETQPADGSAGTAALASRLQALERRLSEAPATANLEEVDEALARLEAAEAEAAARAEEAAAAAAGAARVEALVRLRSAVASGAGFEAELAALDDPELQATLAPHVTGVPTLETLQATFPDAARQSLQLARAGAEGEGWGDRFVDFLAGQTGARSLTPREGPEPDAILSRADFALSERRLADAVAEVRTLDPALQAPLSDWLAQADARIAVDTALGGL